MVKGSLYVRSPTRTYLTPKSVANTTLARRSPHRAIVRPRTGKKSPIRTATKVGRSMTQRVHTDGPVSNSYFKFYTWASKNKIPKGAKSMIGDQTYVTQDIGKLTCATSGVQVSATVAKYYAGADIYNQFDSVMTAGFIPGATGGGSPGTFKNCKIQLEKVRGHTMFTNQTNDVVHMTLYDVIARRDNQLTAYVLPENAWNSGASDQGSANAPTIVGSTPFQTLGFTQGFKVLKVTDVQLHSGGHHVHITECKPRHVMSFELAYSTGFNTVPCNLEGLTCYTLMCIHGYPTNNDAGTEITTAKVSITYVTSKQYHFRLLQTTQAKSYMVNQLAAAPAQSDIINDLTGSVTVVTRT